MITNFLDLRARLKDDYSLCVTRIGNVETTSILNNGIYDQMFSNAGFFCKDKSKENEVYTMWKNKYIRAIMTCDLMLDVITCSSFNIVGQLLNNLNTWIPTLVYPEDPKWWIENIINEYEGTIGIVSYFKKDIESQLTKMEKIWPDLKIKNKFVVIKSLNTISQNEPDEFNDWLEVYDDLEKRVLKRKDIKLWLVSSGCYGLPLCNAIACNNKKAIYVGGILQTIFGLKGKRWDDRKVVNRWYNKHWKYPKTKPKNAEQIEGGCYWGNDDE